MAPDNDWLHDQEEKLPVLDFINRYYKSFHDINIIGQKLKVKENLLQYAMGKELLIMDKSLLGILTLLNKDYGKAIRLFGDQLSTLENSDLNPYKGLPFKAIGLRLKRIDDSLKKV